MMHPIGIDGREILLLYPYFLWITKCCVRSWKQKAPVCVVSQHRFHDDQDIISMSYRITIGLCNLVKCLGLFPPGPILVHMSFSFNIIISKILSNTKQKSLKKSKYATQPSSALKVSQTRSLMTRSMKGHCCLTF